MGVIGRRVDAEFGEEVAHPTFDVVADGTDGFDTLAGGIGYRSMVSTPKCPPNSSCSLVAAVLDGNGNGEFEVVARGRERQMVVPLALSSVPSVNTR